MDDLFALRNSFIKATKNDTVYGICCGINMIIDTTGNYLQCKSCGNLKTYIPDMLMEPESQETQHTSEGKIYYGVSRKKTKEEAVKALIQEYKKTFNRTSNVCIDDEAMYIACSMMYDVCSKTPKKKENRPQLFAACLKYACKELGFNLTDREIINYVGLKVEGTSTGETFLLKHIVSNDKDVQLDKMNYRNVIYRKLRNFEFEIPFTDPSTGLVYYKKQAIDSEENIDFCCELIEEMLDKNIGCNTYLITKIAGVIYYLLVVKKYSTKLGKKVVAGKLGIGQHSMIKAYNLLCTDECQEVLDPKFRLSKV